MPQIVSQPQPSIEPLSTLLSVQRTLHAKAQPVPVIASPDMCLPPQRLSQNLARGATRNSAAAPVECGSAARLATSALPIDRPRAVARTKPKNSAIQHSVRLASPRKRLSTVSTRAPDADNAAVVVPASDAAAAAAAAAIAVDAAAPAWRSGSGGVSGDGRNEDVPGTCSGGVSGAGSGEGTGTGSGERSGDGSGTATLVVSGNSFGSGGCSGGSAAGVGERRELAQSGSLLRLSSGSARAQLVVQHTRLLGHPPTTTPQVFDVTSGRVLANASNVLPMRSYGEARGMRQFASDEGGNRQNDSAAHNGQTAHRQQHHGPRAHALMPCVYSHGDSHHARPGHAHPSLLPVQHPAHAQAAYFSVYSAHYPSQPQIHPFYYQPHTPQRPVGGHALVDGHISCRRSDVVDGEHVQHDFVEAGETGERQGGPVRGSRSEGVTSRENAREKKRWDNETNDIVDTVEGRAANAKARGVTMKRGSEATRGSRVASLEAEDFSTRNDGEQHRPATNGNTQQKHGDFQDSRSGRSGKSLEPRICFRSVVLGRKRSRKEADASENPKSDSLSSRSLKEARLVDDKGNRARQRGLREGSVSSPCDASSVLPEIAAGRAVEGKSKAHLQTCPPVMPSPASPSPVNFREVELAACSTVSPSISSGDEADVESGDSASAESFARQAHKKRMAVATNGDRIPPAAHEFDSDLSVVRKIITLWNAGAGESSLEASPPPLPEACHRLECARASC